MAIINKGGYYLLDFYPDGRAGKHVRKRFKTKKEALAYQKLQLASKDTVQAQIVTLRNDDRRLLDFIVLWYDLHGQSLKSSIDTRNRLNKLANALGNPIFRHFSVEDFANYRKDRMSAGISEATLNREMSTLKALYRELKRLQLIDFDFPLLNVRKLKEKRTELSYLKKEQITKLLEQVAKSENLSLPFVVDICLATGARWSESEGLKLSNLQNGGFYFTDTKNGHSRFVPVSQALYQKIHAELQKGDFKPCYGAYRSAFKRSGLEVPKGQLAHILRHTFASHFVMSRGDIRTLQQILGHSSLQMTMRYSHLAPEFLNQAVTLNPLEN